MEEKAEFIESIFSSKFLQTNRQLRSMKYVYFDFCCTFCKNGNENNIEKD